MKSLLMLLLLRFSETVAFHSAIPRRFGLHPAVVRLYQSATSEEAPPAPTATQYPFAQVEPKWQAYWEKHQTFITPERSADREKKYVLDMFPYPSGAGLHVGHPEGYTGKFRFTLIINPFEHDASCYISL